jgi:hypothetical protein
LIQICICCWAVASVCFLLYLYYIT